jgi:hypothetical protein
MLIDGGEADPGPFGHVAYVGLVEIVVGKDIENRLFEALVNFCSEGGKLCYLIRHSTCSL